MGFEQYIDAADKHARKDRSGSAHDHVVRVAELACRMADEHATREARTTIEAAEARARAAEQRAEELTRELAAAHTELEALRHEPPSHGEPVPQGDDGWTELPETDKHAVVKSTPPPPPPPTFQRGDRVILRNGRTALVINPPQDGAEGWPAGHAAVSLEGGLVGNGFWEPTENLRRYVPPKGQGPSARVQHGGGDLASLSISCTMSEWESDRAGKLFDERATRYCMDMSAGLEPKSYVFRSHIESVVFDWAESLASRGHVVKRDGLWRWVKSTPTPPGPGGPAGEICLMYGAGKFSGLTVSCVRGEWESVYSGQLFEGRATRFCLDAAEGSYPLREDLAAALAVWSGSLVSRGYIVKRDGLWRWVEESPPGITKGED